MQSQDAYLLSTFEYHHTNQSLLSILPAVDAMVSHSQGILHRVVRRVPGDGLLHVQEALHDKSEVGAQ